MGTSARRVSKSSLQISRPGGRPVVVGAAVVVLVVLALFAYRMAYRDRIYPGVTVGGVPVGGMTSAAAESALTEHLTASLNAPLTVEVNGRTWDLSRSSLGARYDVSGLAEQAVALGRTGSLLDQVATSTLLVARPRDLDATVLLGDADWSRILQPIAQAVDRPAVDAKLSIAPDRSVRIVPDQSGARLDPDAARAAIAAALTSDSTENLTLATVPIAPAVRAADLAGAQKEAQVALSGPLVVRDGGRTWTLSAGQIQAALVLPRSAGNGKLTPTELDPAALDRFLNQTAEAIDRPGRSARLVLSDGAVTIAPSQTSRTLDRNATAAAIQAALLTPDRSVGAVARESPPPVVEADLASAETVANQLIGAPIVLNGPDGRNWTIEVTALQKLLSLPSDSASAANRIPRLDPAKLNAYVATVAKGVDRPALNARFQYVGGQVKLLRDGASGYQVDQPAAVALIQQVAASDDRTATLPVTTVAPAFTAQDAGKLADLQLIAQNATSYAGSIPPRRHNVELATSMLNGVVVAPGQVFSFNQELGPQTLDRGFQVGYGIVAEANGGVKTVPSVGGGICQVSTTLFQPIFWTGYEIEERHWHAYWIAHYASHGYPGLDDTVDDASGLDFQFKNTTANPLLIQSSTDGTQVHFSVYGVPPTWTVTVDKPVVTDVVKTDRQLQVQEDPTLQPGQQIYTEAAEDGFTVTVHRHVDDGSGNVRDLTLRSVYAPSHNVMAVGPRG